MRSTEAPSAWFAAPDLPGPRLALTAIGPDDAEEFCRALGSPAEAGQVLEHLSYPPPDSPAQARALIERFLADDDRIAYAQRLRSTGELVGTTSFYQIRPDARSIAIGHTWLARRHWGTGLNAESKLLMLRRAFDRLAAERVVWHTDVRNTRSQAAIERLGATRDGLLRRHRVRRDGSWRDTVQYSMLRAEWPAARLGLVDRLPLAVERHPAASRYRAVIGVEQVGVVDYVEADGVAVITHTRTEPVWRRCGLAARTTALVLADLRERGLGVRAQCSFTRTYLAGHPEWADLVR